MRHKKSTAYPIIFAAILSGILIILANAKAGGEAGQITNRLTLQEDLVNAQYDIENTYNLILRTTEIIIDQSYIDLIQKLQSNQIQSPCRTIQNNGEDYILLKDGRFCDILNEPQKGLSILLFQDINTKLSPFISSQTFKTTTRNIKINPLPDSSFELAGEITLQKDINQGLKTKLKKQISKAYENPLNKIREIVRYLEGGNAPIENEYYKIITNMNSPDNNCYLAEVILKRNLENIKFESNQLKFAVCNPITSSPTIQ